MNANSRLALQVGKEMGGGEVQIYALYLCQHFLSESDLSSQMCRASFLERVVAL